MRRRWLRTGRESVYVTGIGAIVPGATGVDEFWRHLKNGSSQFGFLSRCDVGSLPVRVSGEVHDFDDRQHIPGLDRAHATKYSRDILMVLSAIQNARNDAMLGPSDVEPARASLIASCSRGPVSWIDAAFKDKSCFADKGAMLCSLPGSATSLAAIHHNVQGTVMTLSNACVGGNQAIGLAVELLRARRTDVALVVGYEFPLAPIVYESLASMGKGVLAAEREKPKLAMKPYTRLRDGFVLSEGVVALCLERSSFARRRNARVYAEVLGQHAINEAANAFSMDLTGKRTAKVVQDLLADHGARPDDVGYYCAHGTGTKYNDIAESRALAVLHENRLRSKWPPIGSIKPIYGHMLGAAGVLNVAATALMLHHATLAPTINYTDPEPDCDHDHVSEGARKASIDLAVSLSFAIGSQTSAVALAAAA